MAPLTALLLFALNACAAPASNEGVGRTTLHQEEGDESADFGDETGGDDVAAGEDVPADEDLTAGDQFTAEDDVAAANDDTNGNELTGTEEPTDEVDPSGNEQLTPNDVTAGEDEPRSEDDPSVRPLSDDEPQDAKSEGATPEKDAQHDPPRSFKDEIDRRTFNKQSNRKSTPLENQRYYNEDGTYWKPNPTTPGRWSKYDSEGNRLETDVPTREMPRETLTDAVPRVWQQWCRAEQEDGFRAVCGGWKGISQRR